jgi:hypothetical protein
MASLTLLMEVVQFAATDASLQQIYGPNVQVTAPQIRPMLRIYYPTPGSNTAASILPPPNGSMGATWVVPQLQKVN